MIPFVHHPALDADIGSRVIREQMRQLYRGGISASIGVLVGVSLLSWILRAYIPFSLLAGWFFGMLGLMIVRLGLIGVYFLHSSKHLDARRWLIRYRVVTGLAGWAWALLPWRVLPMVDGNIEAVLYIVVVSVAVVSIGLHVLAIDAITATLYVSPLIIAIGWRFYQGAVDLDPALNIWLPVYLLFVNLLIVAHYRTQIANLVLRFDNELLLDQSMRDKEAAEQASEAKSRFLAMVSHEIRFPLSGVLGMVELLDQTPLDVRQRRFLGNIRASAEGLLDLIDDVLDYSRAEASGREANHGTVTVSGETDMAKPRDAFREYTGVSAGTVGE